jgi:hypothetical protein
MRGAVQGFILLVALSFPIYVLVTLFPGVLQGVPGVTTAAPRTSTVRTAAARVASGPDVDRPLDGYQPQPTATAAERYSPLDAAPPPTVTVPERTAPAPTPTAVTATARARGTVYNTGGIGAVLRAAPVSGNKIASLREGMALDVLERTSAGGRDWFRVRTPDGTEGWISGLVLQLDARADVPAAGPSTQQAQPAAQAQPAQVDTALMAQPAQATAGHRVYMVQPGDQLKHIAAAYGVSMASILAANDVPNPDSLSVGQVLVIPDPT